MYFNKLIAINFQTVHMTLMTLGRSLCQRSRSASDGHRNLVNATDSSRTTRGLCTKTYTNLSYSRATNLLGFEGHEFKVKVTG